MSYYSHLVHKKVPPHHLTPLLTVGHVQVQSGEYPVSVAESWESATCKRLLNCYLMPVARPTHDQPNCGALRPLPPMPTAQARAYFAQVVRRLTTDFGFVPLATGAPRRSVRGDDARFSKLRNGDVPSTWA